MALAPREAGMPKTVTSPLQKKLAAMLVEHRKATGLRQVDLAKKLGCLPVLGDPYGIRPATD
jgi:hypothetical protein